MREHFELIDALKDQEEPEFTNTVRKTLSGFAGPWLSVFDVDHVTVDSTSAGIKI